MDFVNLKFRAVRKDADRLESGATFAYGFNPHEPVKMAHAPPRQTAALRCLRVSGEAGGVPLIIDAKSERAAGWYASYGAEPLRGKPLTLVMPLATFAADLQAKGLL